MATGKQLYVLNRAGRLKLVEDEELEPIKNAQADRAIKRSMGRSLDQSLDGGEAGDAEPHE